MHTIIYAYYKKTPRPKPPRPRPHNCWPLSAACCPAARSGAWLPCQKGRFYDRLFTPLVTLWYLIFQRLAADHTLEKVVTDAQAGGANALRPGLSQKLRSSATVSFSNARQRLPLAFLRQSLTLQAGRILALNPHTLWHNLIVCLLDGSTVRLRPYGDIRPPLPAQRQPSPERSLLVFDAGGGGLLRP